MEPEAHNPMPYEPSLEDTREALRRRAQLACTRSLRIGQAYRATVQEGLVRREHDRAVENAVASAAHGGDDAARDALVRRYVPIVSALARRCGEESSTPQVELLSAGFSSLLVSIEGWDPAAGVTFREYAVSRTRAAMQTAAT